MSLSRDKLMQFVAIRNEHPDVETNTQFLHDCAAAGFVNTELGDAIRVQPADEPNSEKPVGYVFKTPFGTLVEDRRQGRGERYYVSDDSAEQVIATLQGRTLEAAAPAETTDTDDEDLDPGRDAEDDDDDADEDDDEEEAGVTE